MTWLLDIIEVMLSLWVVVVLLPKLSDKIDELSSTEDKKGNGTAPTSTLTCLSKAEIITSLPSTENRNLSPLNKDLVILKFKATDENDIEFDVILYADKGNKEQSSG